MNAARISLGVMAAAAATGAFALVPASFAQEPHHPAQAAPSPGERAGMPMMVQMETMGKIKAALEEAKGAAEAEGAKTAVAKIEEALKLLEQDHQAMHGHMAQMMQKMKQRMENMQAMEQEMQKMHAEMGKREETKPMQAKMERMKQKMQEMHEQMRAQAKEGHMQCPMCKKMMAGEPKVVNTVCPIMGRKVDPYNVPDDLIREFEGQKIGFCCPSCPPAWDKLSDQAKKEKLAAVMAKPPKQEGSEGHEAHHGD